jgi:hypothetical protein
MALVAALGIAAASLALAYITRGAPGKAAAAQVQKLLTGGTAAPSAKQSAAGASSAWRE